jgi:hypothetical protein
VEENPEQQNQREVLRFDRKPKRTSSHPIGQNRTMSKEQLIDSIQGCLSSAERHFQNYKVQQFDSMIQNPEECDPNGLSQPPLPGEDVQEAETEAPSLPPEAETVAKEHDLREFLIGTIAANAPLGVEDLHQFTSEGGYNQAQVLEAITYLVEDGILDNAAEVLSLTSRGETEWETIRADFSF